MAIETIGIDHIYISVRKMAVSESFYDRLLVEVLGFRKNHSIIDGDEHVHYSNRHHGYSLRPAHAGTPAHDPYGPGLHHLCLRVASEASVDEVAEGLKRVGINATEPALYRYDTDYYALFFEDPDGVRLEVTNFRARRRARMFESVSLPAELPIDGDLRLRLRSIKDADAIFRLVDEHRAYLRRWLPWVDHTHGPRDVRSFLQVVAGEDAYGTGMTFVIEHQAELAGVIAFKGIDRANRHAEIGYWLRADRQGQGIMTACTRRLLQYGFEELNLNRVVISAAMGNAKSQAVPQRLGFRQEGVARQAEWLNDRFVDLARYSLLREDWQAGAP